MLGRKITRDYIFKEVREAKLFDLRPPQNVSVSFFRYQLDKKGGNNALGSENDIYKGPGVEKNMPRTMDCKVEQREERSTVQDKAGELDMGDSIQALGI